MLNYCNIRALCCAFLLSFVGLSHAQDIVTIESQVTGSKEQPKVITIVPWREPGTLLRDHATQSRRSAPHGSTGRSHPSTSA